MVNKLAVRSTIIFYNYLEKKNLKLLFTYDFFKAINNYSVTNNFINSNYFLLSPYRALLKEINVV